MAAFNFTLSYQCLFYLVYFSDHIDDPPPPMSGTKLFLIIVCALLGLCVCIIGGVMVFQRSQDNTRKRLY